MARLGLVSMPLPVPVLSHPPPPKDPKILMNVQEKLAESVLSLPSSLKCVEGVVLLNMFVGVGEEERKLKKESIA